MNADLLADLEFIRRRDFIDRDRIDLRRRDATGRPRPETLLRGRPVIAVGDLAAYESYRQAGIALGVSTEKLRQSVCGNGIQVAHRPWMLATPPLMRAIVAGGWPEACRRGLVPAEHLWAVGLGRLRPTYRRKPCRNGYQFALNHKQVAA